MYVCVYPYVCVYVRARACLFCCLIVLRLVFFVSGKNPLRWCKRPQWKKGHCVGASGNELLYAVRSHDGVRIRAGCGNRTGLRRRRGRRCRRAGRRRVPAAVGFVDDDEPRHVDRLVLAHRACQLQEDAARLRPRFDARLVKHVGARQPLCLLSVLEENWALTNRTSFHLWQIFISRGSRGCARGLQFAPPLKSCGSLFRNAGLGCFRQDLGFVAGQGVGVPFLWLFLRCGKDLLLSCECPARARKCLLYIYIYIYTGGLCRGP